MRTLLRLRVWQTNLTRRKPAKMGLNALRDDVAAGSPGAFMIQSAETNRKQSVSG
ncbi:MAG: hypothetical protein WB500_07795 [Rhodoplanes sp.]